MAHARRDLGERLLAFAVSVGSYVRTLRTDQTGAHVTKQLLRCGTAPAAIYSEAKDAESPRDYVHKMKIGLKELREALYWSRFAKQSGLGPLGAADRIVSECDQLIAIFVTCIKRARDRGE